MGFWPPSKPIFFFAPEREPAPLWPRPEVLPKPEPSPRPMRLRALREPRAGLRLCSPKRSSAIPLHLQEVTDLGQLALDDRVVGALGGLADPAQAERAQRLALLAAGAVG